ncbi:MAG: alcohol dehydrogenase, partial [Gemmatimonadetes bacterium]|nr:alcohol dehydrogenase [Gemmatimonadota bacterium]
MAFQTGFDFRSPTRLIHGPGSIRRLPELLPEGVKVLVVTDPGLRQAGVVERVSAVLDEANIPCAIYDGVVGNPATRSVHAGLRQYEKEKCGALIGVGGGSSMDVAK